MRKLLKSFLYALAGIRHGWREERNFRLQSVIAVAAVVLAFVFQFSFIEWALVVFAITLVLAAELTNTATEEILDLLEKRHQHQVGLIKDLAAAVVLVFSSGAFVIGCLLFIHHFFV
jgi:diacylglycerol kinase